MSRYAQLFQNPQNLNTRYVQSADPDDLTRKVRAVLVELAAIGTAPVLVAMNLAGAGDGHTFVVEIQSAPDADTNEVAPEIPVTVTNGVPSPNVVCYMAGSAGTRPFTAPDTPAEVNELSAARAAAIARNGFTGQLTQDDELLAGAAQGTRFMGLILGTFALPV